MWYYAYDCSDCINNATCDEQQSAACGPVTGSCVQCQLVGPNICPGAMVTYMVVDGYPPCFFAYTVYYPTCTTQWYDAIVTACDGQCV